VFSNPFGASHYPVATPSVGWAPAGGRAAGGGTAGPGAAALGSAGLCAGAGFGIRSFINSSARAKNSAFVSTLALL
jgi:hypothetical protein